MAENPEKGDQNNAHIVLIDETGCMLNPLVRRSLAPRGQTPILVQDGGRRQKTSVIAALSLSPRRGRVGLYFSTFPNGTYNGEMTAWFIRSLLRFLRGQVTAVWDNGGHHGGPHIRQLASDFPRLTLERLPPYAPELNPVEYLWSHLKHDKLVNLAAADVDALDELVTRKLNDVALDQQLLRTFFQGSPLDYDYRTLVI